MSNSKMDRQATSGEEICSELGEATTDAEVEYLKPNYYTQLLYPNLDETKKTKVNELLEEVNAKVSIDYSKQEIRDIKTAVHMMLERLATKVNKRGMFKISRIEPCGSMAEQTAVWKFWWKTGDRYTEFDFLAVLAYSSEIIHRDHDCGQCIRVGVNAKKLYDYSYGRFPGFSDKFHFDKLFKQDLNTCLGSACDCYSVLIDELTHYPNEYSYILATARKSDFGCDKCVVEMPTGFLRANVPVRYESLSVNCSLKFRWTSKAKTLIVRGELLPEDFWEINELTILVDFLPALEVLKTSPDENAACEHDFFIVPKRCNVCNRIKHWRKSKCMAEITFIVNEMSEKHRKCYQIIKYVLARFIDRAYIEWYYVKTVVLNHSRKCSDSSEGLTECVLKIITELKHVYETKTLKLFHDSGVGIFNANHDSEWIFQRIIERLCSVTNNDTCSTLLQSL